MNDSRDGMSEVMTQADGAPLTTDAGARTLTPGFRILRAAVVLLAAAGSLLLWVVLSEAAWPHLPAAEDAAREASARAGEAATVPAGPLPFPVARRTPGNIPVPQGAREFYPVQREGAQGISFQAFYETPEPPQAVDSFYRQLLTAEGWRADREAQTRLSNPGAAQQHLVYRRPGQHLMVNLYPAPGGGCEYRISLIARPGAQAPESKESAHGDDPGKEPRP